MITGTITCKNETISIDMKWYKHSKNEFVFLCSNNTHWKVTFAQSIQIQWFINTFNQDFWLKCHFSLLNHEDSSSLYINSRDDYNLLQYKYHFIGVLWNACYQHFSLANILSDK